MTGEAGQLPWKTKAWYLGIASLLHRPSNQSMTMMMPLRADDGVLYPIVVCICCCATGTTGSRAPPKRRSQ